jgi:hypothetical protein
MGLYVQGDLKKPQAAAYIINHVLTCKLLATEFTALGSASITSNPVTNSTVVLAPTDSMTTTTPRTIQPQEGGKMSTELTLAIAGASILTLVTAIAIITVLVTVSRKSRNQNKGVEVMGNWDPANAAGCNRNSTSSGGSSSPLSSPWSEVDRQEAGADEPVIAESELNWGSDMDQPVPNPLPPGYSGRSYASSTRH